METTYERTSYPDIRHLVIPGTFDPVTLGHMDVIRRSRRLKSQITVAVAASLGKNGSGTAFPLEERVEMIKEALLDAGITDIAVRPFEGLLMDFCHEVGAGGVVKGLRQATDFLYELQQFDLNSRISPDIESIFVMSSPEFGHVSSSAVRELVSFGANVSQLVPPTVLPHLEKRFGKPADAQ